MKLYKSWLLLATCTINLVITTYATTTEQRAKQLQAEVNLQQVVVSPARSLKYGDKTTKKIPNKEVIFLPTSSIPNNNKHNINLALPAGKEHDSRNRPRSRPEHNEQIYRRYDRISQQNQLDVQHEIPIVQKNRQLFIKPINASVGQQQTAISNRTRLANTLAQTQQQQPLQLQSSPHYSTLNIQPEKIFTETKTTHKSRQRIATTTSHSIASTNVQRTPLSAHNSNVRTQLPAGSNPSIARHQHGNQRNRNNNNIKSNSQPLLASSNAVIATGGLLSKTEIISNKRRGNISDNQSVSSNSTNNVRQNSRKFTSNASTITIISSTSTSTTSTTTTARPPFQLPSSFNIFTPEFWQFLNPNSNPIPRLQLTTSSTITTTRKPPKKYKPSTQISTKEEKLSLVKPKPTIKSRTTTKQPVFDTNNNKNKHNNNNNNDTLKKVEGPFRIALPTFNILNSKRETNDESEKGKRNVEKENINLRKRFDCPRESEVRFQLFPKICKIDDDCKVWNREEICCEIFGAKSCVSGMSKPLEETSHAPILGVIPRKCPSRPLAELWWDVKECETDMDCWPRVCCPDGRRRYCRTSQPELNTVPVSVQRSFNYLSEYLECTPPPPPIFDLHPKSCTSTLDCFPNVCCQEAGLRHCRPPKKSLLTMFANVFNVDFVKRLTQNIVIK